MPASRSATESGADLMNCGRLPTTERTFTAATVPTTLLAALTFTTFSGHPESVWVSRADGSHARRITTAGYAGALSPDGRWLTFERDASDAYFVRLFLVDLRTGRTRRLGESMRNERWAPTDARVAFTGRNGLLLYDARSRRG